MIMKPEPNDFRNLERSLHEITVGYILNAFNLPTIAYVYGGFGANIDNKGHNNYTLYEFIPGSTLHHYLLNSTLPVVSKWILVIIAIDTIKQLNKQI